MIGMLRRYLRLNWRELAWAMGALTGLLVLWEGVLAVVTLAVRADGIAVVGNIVLPIIAWFVALAVAIGHTITLYPLSLKLSRTRRETVGGVLLFVLTEGLLLQALAWALGQLEGLLARQVWVRLAGSRLEFEQVDFLPLWGLLLVAAGCALLGFAIGALLLRFGRRAGWTVWGLWMAVCLFTSYTDWGEDSLTVGIVTNRVTLWSLAALGIGLLLWSLWELLRAPVRGN